MATMQQLEIALRNAHSAGDTDAARKLAAVLSTAKQDPSFDIPGMEQAEVPGTSPVEPEATVGEQIVGAGEAALTAATGATTGLVGGIGGFIKGVVEEVRKGEFGSEEAADRIEQEFAKGLEAGTYAPRTQVGQEITQAVGEISEQFAPLAPLAGQAAAIGGAARAAAPAARAIPGAVTKTAQKYSPKISEAISRATAKIEESIPFTKETAGAARIPEAQIRAQRAEDLPVPVKLTKGEREQDFVQRQFEAEARKTEVGAPLRRARADANLKLQQNVDAFIEKTGAEATELRDIGVTVDKALKGRLAKDKKRINNLYEIAKKKGETSEQIELNALADYINQNKAEAATIPVIKFARAKGEELGALRRDADGNVAAGPVSINDSETLRQAIRAATQSSDSRDLHHSSKLKQAIDTGQEGAGGEFYKKARAARLKLKHDFFNTKLTKDLLSKKGDTDERVIALENTLSHITSKSTPLDSVRQLGKLVKLGKGGRQAWAEVQGGILREALERATKTTRTDTEGRPLLSPAQVKTAFTDLDKSGKLEYLYGKTGAEQLREFSRVVQDILGDMDGTVNYSNTSSALIRHMNSVANALARAPVPSSTLISATLKKMLKSMEDAELEARIEKAVL